MRKEKSCMPEKGSVSEGIIHSVETVEFGDDIISTVEGDRNTNRTANDIFETVDFV